MAIEKDLLFTEYTQKLALNANTNPNPAPTPTNPNQPAKNYKLKLKCNNKKWPWRDTNHGHSPHKPARYVQCQQATR